MSTVTSAVVTLTGEEPAAREEEKEEPPPVQPVQALPRTGGDVMLAWPWAQPCCSAAS